ncbi:MAG: family 43 glycosylhydrolase, partial [Muribaculaceae bacterium]|nr:family 43 glycosylhydrolase [Muribaculaceae bacterium]
ASDTSGLYEGTACDGARLEKIGDVGIVNLGDNGGYFDFGTKAGEIISSLSGDFTISVDLCIPSYVTLGQNGNFIFNFSRSSSTGYLFFGANQSRYSITHTDWSGEQTVSADTQFPKGEWTNLIIVQNGDNASVYFNGMLKKTSPVSMHPAELGATPQNWLGRSPYSGDVMLKGAMYADFRIYQSALSPDEISEIAANPGLRALNAAIFKEQLRSAIAMQNFDFSDIRSNVTLPGNLGNGITVIWQSGDETALSSTGTVNRPQPGESPRSFTLSATASKGDVSETFTFNATVQPLLSDEECVTLDLSRLSIPGNTSNLRSDLALPSLAPEGSGIIWTSCDRSYITDAGKLLRLSPAGSGTHEVTLTARAVRNNASATRDFTVTVAEEEDYSAYLFAYFPSNSDENLYYALGTDGYNFTPLNNGRCVMASDTVAIKKGIRDPHILRGVDGKTFYMVATDMRCAEGWSSNRGIVMYRSTDLVNWTHSTVHFPDRFPEWKNVTRVWAPEVIWDPDYANEDGSRGRYMVYFSLLTNDGKCTYDKIYYCYANNDFTGLISDPVYLYDRGSATIDGDIIYDERTQLYHMVYKNEGTGGICQVTASRLTAEPGMPDGSQWSNPSAPLQQTSVGVEGAGMFRLINSDTWILMYDCYGDGYYQFCSSDDLEHFTLRAQTKTSGAFTPRHGTVMAVTPAEVARLLEAFPMTATKATVTGARNPQVRTDNFTVSGNTVYMPVTPAADLTSFDPQLTASPGASVSPSGPQDFTAGAVTYTVTCASSTETFEVSAAIEANPVLPGFHADPEVLFSHLTGRFYIYPTTDGYPGWGGYSFDVYSSADLVNWQRETCILDLSSEAVCWATGNAWAPSIEEKFENGAYRYYFYFSGHNPDYNYKTLGCAVADTPVGPFRDLGYPMVSENIASGQLIDSDVFTDPTDGQSYFYWGNGSLVASRLDGDMTSPSDPRVITPAGGSLSTYAFREGVYVFCRNGIYYFLWSVDDTGSRNYHVAYGTSDSPLGPITVAANPVILKQDSENRIYGTGHNSVINVPGRDEWYIVYHRINKNYVSNDPGVHREVCIDKLEFNADGTIRPVTPTHRGISPVDITDIIENLASEQTISADTPAGTVVSTRYYTPQGTLAGTTLPLQRGIYIRVETLDNGNSRASKVAI